MEKADDAAGSRDAEAGADAAGGASAAADDSECCSAPGGGPWPEPVWSGGGGHTLAKASRLIGADAVAVWKMVLGVLGVVVG